MYNGDFFWFFGVVEDRDDPTFLGRVRVRIFGIHTDNKQQLPTEDLPWAYPVQSIGSAAISGYGEAPVGILPGTHVFGFFRDGQDMQEPVVLGTVAGVPTVAPNPNLGFNDPDGQYPDILDQPDVSVLARNNLDEDPPQVTIAESERKSEIPAGLTDSFDEIPSSYAAKYPYNQVRQTEAGHYEEFDNTPGAERIKRFHKSGSFEEYHPDGSNVRRIVNHQQEVIGGSKSVYVTEDGILTVDGNYQINVLQSCEIVVSGNCNLKVSGNSCQSVDGTTVMHGKSDLFLVADGNLILQGNKTYINGDDVTPNELCPALDITALDVATQNDEQGTDEGMEDSEYNKLAERSSKSIGNEVDEDTTEPAMVASPEISSCGITSEWEYSDELAYGYTIQDLSTRAVFPHQITAQQGLTETEILCNLKALIEGALYPLERKYGRTNIQINSGFRSGSSGSQHELGQAIDIQFPGFSDDDYYEAAKWVRDNIAFDQFILEYGGKRPWFHISFKTSGNRYSLLTRTRPGVYKGGLIKVA